jgi:aldehyde:ferredoxin oxidoreductase
MLYGYAGKILYVNLTNEKITTKPTPVSLVRNYIGGNGVASKLLYDYVKPGIDPLSPDNKLIFATGPATGTALPNKGYIVTFKSPLTGIYASCSSGGSFGAEFKRAGYDVLIVDGKSEKPVYIWIRDQEVHIKNASHLWGKDTFETNEMIKSELGDSEVKVARIGPAGENLVKIASIMNDYSRSAARCGPGAVMGSKNLKAIAVRGTGNVNVAKPDQLIDFVKEYHDLIKSIPSTGVRYPRWGTFPGVKERNFWGTLPTMYWRKGIFGTSSTLNNPEAIRTKIVYKDKACEGCPVYCAKLSVLDGGKYAGTIVEGPDYETIFALGSLCGNEDIEAIAKANEVCDRVGIDTISAGNIVAFAMDCYDRGIINSNDTYGMELRWGDGDATVKLLEKIAKREGIGNVLAEGVKEAAKIIGDGAEAYAVHVKGLELAGIDPRGVKGMALSFAVADRGGCHNVANIYKEESSGKLDRLAAQGKAVHLKALQEQLAVADSMIYCRFFRDTYSWATLAEAISLLTGIDYTEDDVKMVGERIVTVTRAFNVREGIRRIDDTLPERFFREPLQEGPSKGLVLNKDEFQKMLDEYYEISGWDENGIPTEAKLLKLGLSDISEDIKTLMEKGEKTCTK